MLNGNQKQIYRIKAARKEKKEKGKRNANTMISRNKHIELKTTKHQKGIQKENELIRELCEMKFKEPKLCT